VRRLAFLVLLGSLALPALAGGMGMAAHDGAHVSVLFGSVTPVKVDALAGEPVDWTNDSVRNHTVTADDESFDSGTLKAGSHYSRVFDATGTFAYHCRLHPYIRGEVDVHRLLLDRPSEPASVGRDYPLAGRAALPAGSSVGIEFDDGSGGQQVAHADGGPEGHFTAQVAPAASGSYRAVSGDEVSPAVALLVLNRSVAARARGGRITATVAPAAPGATVVLQLYLKERFGWWPVAARKLDQASRASFSLPHHRRVSARVLLTLPDRATALATSEVLKLPKR
jgi:plastocyanin